MKWSTIRALGKVKYFNVCYVVLLGVPLLAEIYIAIHKLGNYPEFPNPLKWLYLASICYAIGIALYQYFCPTIIKMYERDIDYLNAEKEVHLNARPDRKLEVILANLVDGQKSKQDRLVELVRLQKASPNTAQQNELDALIAELHPSCVQQFLFSEYKRQNEKWPLLSWICGLFYLAGTGIMLWLLVHKSIKVFKA
jgi:hypothetical protein